MNPKRRLILAFAVGLVCALAAVALDHAGTFDGVEGLTWNARVRTLAGRTEAPVKLVLLDQASLDWGKDVNGLSWPWPRNIYNYAIDFLQRAGASAIALDVLYTEPHDDVAADREFAGAIAEAPTLILPVLPSDAVGSASHWPDGVNAKRLEIEGLETWLADHPDAPIDQPRAMLPIPELLAAAPHLAHVRGVIEHDNVIRRTLPLQRFDGRVLPSLGLAAYLVAHADASPVDITDSRLHIGGTRVPLDPDGRAILSYYQPRPRSSHAFETYAMADVLASEVAIQSGEKPKLDPAIFKDSIVFIGFSAPGLYDLKPTPFSRATPGVEVHATIAANLIDNASIAAAPGSLLSAATVALSLIGALVTILAARARQIVIAVIVLAPLPFAAGFVAYGLGVWWPIVTPLVGLIAAMSVGVVINYATEGRQRRFIRRAFERYLNADVVEQLVADPSRLTLGGEHRTLTLLFGDLSGFTTLSAIMPAERATAVLNAVLTDLTEVIFDHGGTLDKYIGDAVMAFWNAPIDQPDHAARAVAAAVECQRRLDARQSVYREMADGHAIGLRIGLHTGEAIVGNMGSRQQFNYSAIGDAVNLASRIEGVNKAFGTRLLISGATRDGIDAAARLRRVAEVTVVGRPEPVVLYEPTDCAAAPPDAIGAFDDAMQIGHDGDWSAALQALRAIDGDPVADAYVAYLTRDGFDLKSWDGVWRMQSK